MLVDESPTDCVRTELVEVCVCVINYGSRWGDGTMTRNRELISYTHFLNETPNFATSVSSLVARI